VAGLKGCGFCKEKSDEYIDGKVFGRPKRGAKVQQVDRVVICKKCWKAILTAAVVMNERQTSGPVPGPAAVPGPGKLWLPASVEPQR